MSASLFLAEASALRVSMDLRLGGMKRVCGGGVKVECVGLMRCLGVVSFAVNHKIFALDSIEEFQQDTKTAPSDWIV